MRYRSPVKTSNLILTCILLAGVILLAFGFYNQHSLMITIGVTVIFSTSLMITIQNLLHPNINR